MMTENIDPPVCPSCERTCITKRITEAIVKVGADPATQVSLGVNIPVWSCAACGEGWRDHEAEAIIDVAIKAHPEASRLCQVQVDTP